MNELGNKIAKRRKDIGMTQIEMADKLAVTRQTISRWEAGTVLPDIDKIGDIAELLDVSCDYLLKDSIPADQEDVAANGGANLAGGSAGVSSLLKKLVGRKVCLSFIEDEGDFDLFNKECTILDFEGNWMKVTTDTKKGPVEKLISVSSILSVELKGEGK